MSETGDAVSRAWPVRGRDVVALLVLATLLRVWNLDSGLWFDEIWLLVRFLRLPLGELATTFESDNVHPLFALCAWFSRAAFGESPWALRLPAVVFGVASVLATYVAGARFLGRREGLAAAALLAVSTHHVAFSQNARGYTGLLLFTILSCLACSEVLRGSGRRWLVLQAVALACATWIHLTGVFVAFAQLVVVALAGGGARRGAAALGVVLAGALSLALHAPILADMLAFFTAEKDDFGATASSWRTPLWMVSEIARSLGVGVGPGLAVLGAIALVFAAGWLETWRRSRDLALYAVLPGVLGQGTMWLLGRNLWPRFFFSLAGFLALVAVVGTWLAARRFARGERANRLAVAVLVVGALAAGWAGRHVWLLPKQDFFAVRAWVEQERPADVVVHTAGLAMFPLLEYAETDWVVTEDASLLDGDGRRWVVASGGTFLEAYYPEVSRRLAEGIERKRFRSQSPDLDLVVVELGADH